MKLEQAKREYLEVLDELNEASAIPNLEKGYMFCLVIRETNLFNHFNALLRKSN